MNDIKVLSAGLLTTVQDLGRFGYRSQGIAISGAMDQSSAKLANLLVDNKETDALLECTMLGPKLEFNIDTYIAITGAQIDVYIDSLKQKMNSTIAIKKGSILNFGKLYQGCRYYIAFASGIQSEELLGSKSSDTVSKIGRAPIQKGESIQLVSTKTASHLISISPLNNKFSNKKIKTFPGPEYHLIEALDLDKIQIRINPNSNRMSYIMNSEIDMTHHYEMISSAVLPGTIQLTPSGQMIALMRDAQTTGGYPRILQIEEEDLDCLAQKRGGEIIEFEILI